MLCGKCKKTYSMPTSKRVIKRISSAVASSIHKVRAAASTRRARHRQAKLAPRVSASRRMPEGRSTLSFGRKRLTQRCAAKTERHIQKTRHERIEDKPEDMTLHATKSGLSVSVRFVVLLMCVGEESAFFQCLPQKLASPVQCVQSFRSRDFPFYPIAMSTCISKMHVAFLGGVHDAFCRGKSDCPFRNEQ